MRENKRPEPGTLGDYLEELRFHNRMNLNDAAKATGITRQYIRSLELNEKEHMSLDVAYRLYNAYKGADLVKMGELTSRLDYSKRVEKNKDTE